MRTKFFFACCVASGLGISLAISRPTAADTSANQPAAQSTTQAQQLVQQALEAEAQGSPSERAALLQQAQQAAPDSADAHWQAGDIKLNGAWTHFDAPSKDPKIVAKLDEYRQRLDQIPDLVREQRGDARPDPRAIEQRRAQTASQVAEQSDLAQWCEKAGLAEQAKLHWLALLKLQPNSKEAQNKLGVVRYRGVFMPASQVTSFDNNLKNQQADFKKWKDQLAALRKQVESGNKADEALDQIRDIHDAAAIPAMEAEFGKGKLELGKAAVEALSKIPDFAATQSLVKFAVLSPHAEVRQDAAKALKARPVYSYAPMLLSALNAPAVVTFNSYQSPDGSTGFQMSLCQDTPWGDKLYTSSGYVSTKWYPSAVQNAQAATDAANSAKGLPQRPLVIGDDGSGAKVANAQANAEKMAMRAIAANDQIAASNDLVISALANATEQDLGPDPSAWWNWWYGYNEYDTPTTQPTQYVSDYVAPEPLYLYQFHACFAAGTPVWTMAGLKQIENIKKGDFVLAQNSATGELAYRPVTDTTVGRPLPLMNIHIDEQMFRCTLGHLFWVSGSGWKMAKELKPGDWLHTATGMVQLDAVERKDEATCYNLVVANFNTYFVGKSMVLVHDITMRRPADTAIVPGLAAAK